MIKVIIEGHGVAECYCHMSEVECCLSQRKAHTKAAPRWLKAKQHFVLGTGYGTSLLGHSWGSLNAVRKYVSSPTTRKGVYLDRTSMYKVVYKVKNRRILVRR
jgi:hypothetical protein